MEQLNLFNDEVKNNFLSTYNDTTRSIYHRVFAKSYCLEKGYNKDLCNFNMKELKYLLHELEPLTLGVSKTNGRIVSVYIDWCISNKYKNNNINPLKSVSVSWYKEFVHDPSKVYITYQDLLFIEDYCNNYQDAVIFRLLWEGVQGKSCSELTNLTKDDIHGNKLTLRDEDGSVRQLSVSDRAIKLIEGAVKKQIYYKRNGEMDDTYDNVRNFNDLVNNKYVLRNSITQTETHYTPVDKHTIYRRINVIREITDYPYLTVKHIVHSAMLHMAKVLLDRYGTLDKEQFEKIAERFNMFNISYLKEFITLEVINKLYNKTVSNIK